MFVYKQSDNAANCTQIAFHSSDVMRVQTPPIALNLSALAHSLLFYLYLYLPWQYPFSKKMDTIQNRQQTVVFVLPDQFITQIFDEVSRFLINLVELVTEMYNYDSLVSILYTIHLIWVERSNPWVSPLTSHSRLLLKDNLLG